MTEFEALYNRGVATHYAGRDKEALILFKSAQGRFVAEMKEISRKLGASLLPKKQEEDLKKLENILIFLKGQVDDSIESYERFFREEG